MLVWIIQTGEPLHIDPGNSRPMRAMNLANVLVARGHRVVLWSADFDHIGKRFRNRADDAIEVEPGLEIRLVPSTGYRRNIGFGRLLDHAVLGFNLGRRIRKLADLPDVAFIGYPPIETAFVGARCLPAKGVPVMLDVKDQWPVIFSAGLPGPLRPLADLLLFPYAWLAKRAMRSATAISAMADGFVDWALRYSGRQRTDLDRAYPLTTEVGTVAAAELREAGEWWDRQGLGADGQRRVYFVGSFSSAFDFTPVRDAARRAATDGVDLKFVLCGDGGNFAQVRASMTGLDNVVFPGWIDRPKIEALAARCIASIAPYRDLADFRLSIPNKVVDAIALGLPLLTPLGGEVARLIDEHEIGIRYCTEGDEPGPDLYKALSGLIANPELQQSIAGNARALYSARFAFDRVYGELADQLEQMAAAAGPKSDKEIERARYEQRARDALAANPDPVPGATGDALPRALREPYDVYAAEIAAAVSGSDARVLEIGAGTGMYSELILQTGARLVATDISASALELLQKRMSAYASLETRVADMESLPFDDGEFDVVCSAGSLSYGDNDVVMNEICRVLKPGGRFVCVDSLNHNPIYRLNRWLQYRRGQRSRSTIERMPTQAMVQRYGEKFGQVRARYFGCITWAVPLLKIFLDDATVARFSAKIDGFVKTSKSAFKLVMVAEKKS